MRGVALLVLALAVCACAGNPPPVPPQSAPDVQGWISAIQASFSGGGTVTVRSVQAGSDAPVDVLELAPGTPVVERRQGKVRRANLSKLGIGDRVSAWWDGPPPGTAPPRHGALRLLVIERT